MLQRAEIRYVAKCRPYLLLGFDLGGFFGFAGFGFFSALAIAVAQSPSTTKRSGFLPRDLSTFLCLS